MSIPFGEFLKKQAHGYAGYGTPLNPNAEGCWWMEYDEEHGTILITGGKIELLPCTHPNRLTSL